MNDISERKTENSESWTAFQGDRQLCTGTPDKVWAAIKGAAGGKGGSGHDILIFDDRTGRVIETDPRQNAEENLKRMAGSARMGESSPELRGPGRPKLGVVAREVTLLPRHWEWLSGQPGGASIALRKLVEAARGAHSGEEAKRRARETAYRFMTTLAGNQPGYEEAIRALFASDPAKFETQMSNWPPDVRRHAGYLAREAFVLEKPEAT